MSEQDELMAEFLPTFRGRCVNENCPDGRTERVLSVAELERTYPATSELPYTPLPPQATHVCDRCGMVYADYQIGFADSQQVRAKAHVEIDVADIDWEPDRVYETDLRTAALELVAACPEDAGLDALTGVIERWIPGFGKSEAEDVIEASDRDVQVFDLADFM